MPKRPPKTVAIAHDDYYAKYVGQTADGRQFFFTTPFAPDIARGIVREFLALYLFDSDGALVEARIEEMGVRDQIDETAYRARQTALLDSLGSVTYRKIKVAPFEVERFGVIFGLIPQAPEEPDDDWSVIVEPGNYMCFWPPWSSGEYDT